MLVFPLNFQIKSLLYSQYYAEACNKQGVTTVRNYGTVRFGQKVRYEITYGIFRKSTAL